MPDDVVEILKLMLNLLLLAAWWLTHRPQGN
jgi:hypothetical protein